MLKKAAQRFFSPQRMVAEEQICGEIPSTKAVYKRAFDVSWPATVESVLVGLVGIVDTIMVGTLGSAAIAAVGLTNQPRFVVLALIMSMNVGVTAITARRRGEGDQKAANDFLRMVIGVSLLLSTLCGGLGYALGRPLLLFAGAAEDTIGMAYDYFRILMLGMPFNGLTLTICAAQRGAGNTRIAMLTNMAGNIINVVFNYLLIGGNLGFPALGVVGAALATVIGQVVGFVMAVYSLMHSGTFLSLRNKGSWRIRWSALGSLARVGSGSFVEQICMRIGFFAYAKVVAGLGTAAFATHQICVNILGMSFHFGDGLSVAASSLIGQSLGEKRPDMAMIYGKVANRLGLCESTILSVGFIVLAWPLMRMFTDEVAIIEAGVPIMYLMGIITFGNIAQVVFAGALRGAGDTRYTAIMSLVSVTFVRPISAWLFCYPLGLGLVGAWCGFMTDQYLRLLFTYPRFKSGKWVKIKV